MTDQTIPADDVRELILFYSDDTSGRSGMILNALEALLPTPPRPTLADITHVARSGCQWMQCEVHGKRQIITLILDDSDHNYAVTLDSSGYFSRCPLDSVTPRPDLPRLEWPGEKKPAPTLPEGWRLADHKDNGRVIVTNATPSGDGRVYYVLPSADPLGYDWLFCDPDELTYLDTTPEEA